MRKPQHPPRAIKREMLPNGVRVIGHTPFPAEAGQNAQVPSRGFVLIGGTVSEPGDNKNTAPPPDSSTGEGSKEKYY